MAAEAHSLLFQLVNVGVAHVDHHTGYFVRANKAFCTMIGYSEAELQSLTPHELTHSDDKERDAAIFNAMKGGEQGGAGFTRCLHKDGQVVWLELRATAFQDDTGNGYNLVVINDVTERRRARDERERLLAQLEKLNETLEQRVEARTKELRRSEQRFVQAFQVGPVAACMTTFGRETFLEVNDAFLSLTGYERGEVVGRHIFELGMWSSREDQAKLAAAQQDGQGFRNLELGLRTKVGAIKHILISAEVIDMGDQYGYLRMFYDITKRKETEEQMHRAIQEVMTDTGWFSHKIMERLANIRSDGTQKREIVDLSQRERQVLERMAGGIDNNAIAADLGIAVQTVRNYVSTVYDKLGVHSRGEAIIWARERGITGP